jgi:HAD superfamily hydrolase (TIGR01490 family)
VPDVAAFDFDGTLIRRGSVFGFLASVRGRRRALLAATGLLPRIAHAALVGGTAADRTKERLFERVLAGVEPGQLDRVAHTYGAHLFDRVRPEIAARVEWHRGRGDAVLVVSASPEVYVGLVARRLGASGVLATRLAVGDDGLLTGRYDGLNCRGEEKIRRLRRWIERSGLASPRLWAYGNSRGDLSMLEAADVGVNVGRLGRLGRLHRFPPLRRSGPAEGGAAAERPQPAAEP